MANTFYTLGHPAKPETPRAKRSLAADIAVIVFIALATVWLAAYNPAGMLSRATFSGTAVAIWVVVAFAAILGFFYILPLIVSAGMLVRKYMPALLTIAAFAFIAALLVP